MGVFGTRVVRSEDLQFLTDGGRYTGDLVPAGSLWASFVRSTEPHGRIVELDTTAAVAMPGVVAIFSGPDIDLGVVPGDVPTVPNPDVPAGPELMPRQFLTAEIVRYVGEPVAVVLSETAAQGQDAVDVVAVSYDPIAAVIDPLDALRDDVVLHATAGTNVVAEIEGRKIDFGECEVVVRRRLVNQRVAASPIEPQASICRFTDEGRLEMWTVSQGPHPVKSVLADVYGLDPTLIRVVSPDVGGAFGAKGFASPETLLLPWLARRTGRPVAWVETRTDSLLSWGHGRGQVQDITIGGSRDGHILAYELAVVQDIGAYPRIGLVLPNMTRLMHPGAYAIPHTSFTSKSVVTNTPPILAYRGAGRPEAAAAIERAVDLFAAEIGMDPAEVRRRNVVPADAFPYTTTSGATYDTGEYLGNLEAALTTAGYANLRADQARRRARQDRLQIGIGISMYVEVTAPFGGREFSRVTVQPDGSAIVQTGTFSHGQGHVTGWKMLVADRTGIPMDRIEVQFGDTDLVPEGGVTGGSRSVQIGGTGLWRAAGHVADRGRELAAGLLEADAGDVVIDIDRGVFHVRGAPAIAKTWADVARSCLDDGEQLSADGDFFAEGGTFPSGAHVAVIEVDLETGRVRLVRLVAVDDAGKILNPMLAEGQIHGGLSAGIAQALYEEVRFSADGVPLTTNFADYGIITAAELPSFETVHYETVSPVNDLGAKGIGESGSIGATPAVQNAVVDALSHLGVRHVELPATPERVWQAIADARKASSPESAPSAAHPVRREAHA